MNINNIINQFASFINSTCEGVDELAQNIENNNKDIMLADKIKDGFYQFIWEIVVESQLCFDGNYLEPYGNGADFYGKSSRVIYPDKLASKKISVSAADRIDYFSNKSTTVQDIDFIRLVNYNGHEYFIKKPFNFALCENYLGRQFLFKLEAVDFKLVPID